MTDYGMRFLLIAHPFAVLQGTGFFQQAANMPFIS